MHSTLYCLSTYLYCSSTFLFCFSTYLYTVRHTDAFNGQLELCSIVGAAEEPRDFLVTADSQVSVLVNIVIITLSAKGSCSLVARMFNISRVIRSLAGLNGDVQQSLRQEQCVMQLCKSQILQDGVPASSV